MDSTAVNSLVSHRNRNNNRPVAQKRNRTVDEENNHPPSKHARILSSKQQQALLVKVPIVPGKQSIFEPAAEDTTSKGLVRLSAVSLLLQRVTHRANGSSKLVVQDIDKDDVNDVFAATEYVEDIFVYLRAREKLFRAEPDYMINQKDITPKMRAILIDWLAVVHAKMALAPDSLYLTVDIIDRFLSRKAVSRQRLQLVGIAALLICSKFEEVYTPEIGDFVYISSKAYNREQILEMERLILTTLNYSISVPTAYSFISRYAQAAFCDTKERNVASLLAELSLMEYPMIKYNPSLVALSCVIVSKLALGSDSPWTATIENYCGYMEPDIEACLSDVRRICCTAFESRLQGIVKKYAVEKTMFASDIVKKWIEDGQK